jgi:hypothetical protein
LYWRESWLHIWCNGLNRFGLLGTAAAIDAERVVEANAVAAVAYVVFELAAAGGAKRAR